MNADKLQQWLETAPFNEEQIYHRGHLVEDRHEVEKVEGRHVTTKRALELNKKANLMSAASDHGQVALFQRLIKHSPETKLAKEPPVYEYIAVKTGRK